MSLLAKFALLCHFCLFLPLVPAASSFTSPPLVLCLGTFACFIACCCAVAVACLITCCWLSPAIAVSVSSRCCLQPSPCSGLWFVMHVHAGIDFPWQAPPPPPPPQKKNNKPTELSYDVQVHDMIVIQPIASTPAV